MPTELKKSMSQKLPMAMPATIPAGWTNAFLENRALWLSAFSDDQPDATRESCQLANRWVEKFCKRTNMAVTSCNAELRYGKK